MRPISYPDQRLEEAAQLRRKVTGFAPTWVADVGPEMLDPQTIQLMRFDEGRKIGRDGSLKEFNSIVPGRKGDQYYFRAVTEDEYNQLIMNGVFTRSDSYQGISPSEEYVTTYFGKNGSHYIIEFEVDRGIDLKSEFEYVGTGEKIESGGMSMGLGKKATPKRAGEKAEGGEYFMQCLKAKSIRWRLIKYIGSELPNVIRG
jgi:hypothetical protein